MKKLAYLTLGITAALSLTACNGDDVAAEPAASSSSASSGASASGGSEGEGSNSENPGTGESASSAADSGSAEAAACVTSNLTFGSEDNSAGETDSAKGVVTVTMKNKGSASCRMSGFAGADVKTNYGDFSIVRSTKKPAASVIAPGETASFNIYFTRNETGGTGVSPSQITVTPPNETHSATVPWNGGSLPVTEADGDPMSMDPVYRVQ